MCPCPLRLGLRDFVGVDATQVELAAGDLEQRAQRVDGVRAGLGLEPQDEDRPARHPAAPSP